MEVFGSNKDPNYLNLIAGKCGGDRLFFSPSGRQLRRLAEREGRKLHKKGKCNSVGLFLVDGLDKK